MQIKENIYHCLFLIIIKSENACGSWFYFSWSVNLFIICFFYRFKCIDLDGNGILTPNEMQFFYEEQLHRMECMAQEPVLFEDILCQMVDMIAPEVTFSLDIKLYCYYLHFWPRTTLRFLTKKLVCRMKVTLHYET